MVGSQYQAEIPSLTSYNEHEKGKLTHLRKILNRERFDRFVGCQ